MCKYSEIKMNLIYLQCIKTIYYEKKCEMEISKKVTIEELVESEPSSVRFLSDKGIRCIACGEPVWGTLEEAAKEKNFTDKEIDKIVDELKSFIASGGGDSK